jgi:hypothetical protein
MQLRTKLSKSGGDHFPAHSHGSFLENQLCCKLNESWRGRIHSLSKHIHILSSVVSFVRDISIDGLRPVELRVVEYVEGFCTQQQRA